MSDSPDALRTGAGLAGEASPAALLASSVIRDDVLALSAYAVPSAAGFVKLDAMENPYSLPDALREAVAKAVAQAALNRYPDPRAPDLQARLRSVMQVPDQSALMLGNGSDEIIAVVSQALARPGACVLGIEPSFVMYRMSAQAAQVRHVGVALRRDFSLDTEAVLAAMATHRPAVVWISYPNNPTGNLYPDADIEAILVAAPGLVVLDEAYNIFAGRSWLPRLPEFPNMMVMRTLSKVGLAGIRLGYAAAHPDWIREFDKLRPPYNVNVLTQAAAQTLLDHASLFDEQARHICETRHELMTRLAAMPGVEVFPSDANFVLARFPDGPALMKALLDRRILVKNLHAFHPLLVNCLRFTVGTPAENALLVSAVADAL
jgi:histidinol-phosphate aminotransferase